MSVTASQLRKDIYNMLDSVIETGKPIKIVRKNRELEIIAVKEKNNLEKLIPHKCMNDDPESFIHTDWSKEWKYDIS